MNFQLRTQRENPLEETLSLAVWSILRLLMITLFVLLLINSAAILTLNLIYETESLRLRYHWPGVLSRNAILGLIFVGIYFLARSQFPISKEPRQDRFSALKSRLLRVVAWLIFLGIAIIETIILAGNLVFHGSGTLVRTQSQTLNLIYSVVFGCTAVILLFRTRTAQPEQGILPSHLRSLISGVLWHGLKKSAFFSFLFAIIFAFGVFIVYKTGVAGRDPPPAFLMLPFPVFSAIYILGGLLCGSLAGSIGAIRGKSDQLVKGCYSLAEPLVKSLLSQIPLEKLTNSDSLQQIWDRGNKLVGETAPGLLARLVQTRYLHAIQGGWILELINKWRQQQTASVTRESLETLLREKIIELTAEDLRTRFLILQWASYALVGALFFSPFLLLYVSG